jgi:ATP-dependent Lon protease
MIEQQNGEPAISVAGFKDIYRLSRIEAALAELEEKPPNESIALRQLYAQMIKLGSQRFTVKPSRLPDIEKLITTLPNFREPLDDIRRQLALCLSSDDPLEIEPILLLGEPGIGKTHFARQLSKLLGTGYAFIGMSSLTAGWIISGASSQWKNAKTGKVFESLVRGDYANPLIVIDEIDKAGSSGEYDPLGALYTLLEHDTAKEFIDEFAEVPIDASHVVWIATANDARRIPEPILNRVNTYEIAPPDREGSMRIAFSIYSDLRNEHRWGVSFPEEPNADVLEIVSRVVPREIRRVLLGAFGNARLSGRNEITVGDISESKTAKKPRIGF